MSFADKQCRPSGKPNAVNEPDEVITNLTAAKLEEIAIKPLAAAKYPIYLDFSSQNFNFDKWTGLEIVKESALKELVGSHNRLSVVGPEVRRFYTMKRLFLSHNEIRSASLSPGLTALLVLDLSYNNLKGMIDLSGLTALQELNLAHNEISGTIGTLVACDKLTRFDISHNKLDWTQEQLEQEMGVFVKLRKLTSLDMKENPFLNNCPGYRTLAVRNVSRLQQLDGHRVSKDEKKGSSSKLLETPPPAAASAPRPPPPGARRPPKPPSALDDLDDQDAAAMRKDSTMAKKWKSDAESYRVDKETLESEVDRLRKKLTRQENESAKREEELAKVRLELEKTKGYSSEIADLKQELKVFELAQQAGNAPWAKDMDTAKAQAMVEEANQKVYAMERELELLKSEVAMKDKVIMQSGDSVKKTMVEMEKVNRELQTREGMLKRKQDELAATGAALDKAKAKIDAMEAQRTKETDEIHRSRQELHLLQQEVETLRKTANLGEEKMGDLRDEYRKVAKLRADLQAAEDREVAALDTYKVMMKENESLKIEVESLRLHVHTAKEDLDRKSEKLDRLEDELSSSEALVTKWKEETSRALQELYDVKEREKQLLRNSATGKELGGVQAQLERLQVEYEGVQYEAKRLGEQLEEMRKSNTMLRSKNDTISEMLKAKEAELKLKTELVQQQKDRADLAEEKLAIYEKDGTALVKTEETAMWKAKAEVMEHELGVRSDEIMRLKTDVERAGAKATKYERAITEAEEQMSSAALRERNTNADFWHSIASGLAARINLLTTEMKELKRDSVALTEVAGKGGWEAEARRSKAEVEKLKRELQTFKGAVRFLW